MTLLERGRAPRTKSHSSTPFPVALDDLEPWHAEVGYGALGRRGDLGYDGGVVRVGGRRVTRALSTHPPARVGFQVPAGTRRFRAEVALNDDVAGRESHASFTVVADGRVVAEAPRVRAGAPAVPLVADVTGAAVIELVVSTSAWEFCHAVWLDPAFDDQPVDGAGAGVVTDPLQRADLTVPAGLASIDRCIVTVGSAGFEVWVDDLLASVRANGDVGDATLAVIALDDAASIHAVAERHGAVVVRGRPRRGLDPSSKSVVYSVGSLLPARQFVCLDADMLVLGTLAPLFGALDACAPDAVLVCGEGNDHGIADLRSALDVAYGGGIDPPFFSRSGPWGRSPLVVNDGLLAGSRSAFLALEQAVRELPGAIRWMDARPDIRWRNQFVVNVALVQSGQAVELDPTWNLQLHVQDVDAVGTRARWRGRDVRVLHFAGVGKHKEGALRDAVRRATHLRTRPWRSVELPTQAGEVPSMLSDDERRLLYWLARHHVRPGRRVVDGGSFLGGSTAALAAGLADRADGPWARAIAAYDRFIVEDYTLDAFGELLPDATPGTSFRPAFDANIRAWSDLVEVLEGDATELGWTGQPIDVLFLDLVKTWALNDVVLEQFLPCLEPGHSVIVQQDELYGYGPWIHLTMELLLSAGCVERLDAMANGSVAYLLTAPVPVELVGLRLRDLPAERLRALMDAAVERWVGEDRAFVELARAMLVAELDGSELGGAVLDAVVARYGDHPRVVHAGAAIRRSFTT